ncbi:hypothetical protein EDB85DRAFT_1571628 [Lactarius pseudohatsudake]|nr:hypothetical protein EDB85DRAFT_1571628 [Lactarius pseudohatsudake]
MSCQGLAAWLLCSSIVSSERLNYISIPGRDTRSIRSNPHKIVRMFFYLIHTARRSSSLPAPRAAIRRPRVSYSIECLQYNYPWGLPFSKETSRPWGTTF